MKKLFVFFVLLAATVSAQEKFEIKNSSKKYNVKAEVEKCGEGACEGKASFAIYHKAENKAFQIINLDYTEFSREETRLSNAKRRYDYQSVVFFEDYNFDGAEDLAVRDGNNSGYGGPSYQIYLYSPARRKFIHNQTITNLAQNGYLGMFEVVKKKRVLRASQKSGCCIHQTEEFEVVGNRLKKVYDYLEEITADEKDDSKIIVTTTTRRLVKGKWITRSKREKQPK